MNCAAIDALICDYVDGTLGSDERRAVESHVAGCPDCAALLADSRAAVAFMEGVEAVEPPPELVTRILQQSHPAPRRQGETAGGSGPLAWLAGLFRPVMAPRFVMGMAMTILSFSMIGRLAGVPQRPPSAADLEPARIWSAMDGRLHRAYDRAVKYYENLRLVYEIQNRLSEWSAQDEQASAEQQRNSRRVIEPVTTGTGEADESKRGETR